MASNVLLLHTMEQSKRRLYSKKGCKECKRRKIKCDEGEPFCWQCHRLKKVCEYPKAGEKVKRASIRKIEWERTSEQQQKQKQQQLQPLLEELQQQQQQQAQAQPQSQPQIQHFQTPPSNGTVNGGTRKRSTSSILNLLNYTPSQTQTVNSLHEYQNTQHQVFHSDHTTPQSHSPIRQSLPNIYPPGLPHEPQIHHRLNQPLLQSATPIPLPTSAIQTTVTTAAVLPPLHQQTDVVVIPTQFPVQPPVPAPSVTSASSLSTPLDGLEFNGFSRDDLDLLASDLNSIVNNIMGESNYEIREDNKADFEIPKNQSPVLLNTYNLTTENLHFMDMVQPIPQTSSAHLSYNTTLSPSASTPYNHFTRQAKEGTTNPNLKPANTTATIHTNVPNMATIPKSVPLDFIKITKPHEKLYLEEFYNEFSGVILPFNAYDETTSTYMNPARDILLTCASRETYLLAAILAQGAKTSFKMSGIQEDEKAYCFYLSKCLQLLGPALDNNKSNEGGNNLTSNIEAVLLTVLLLTSANASNTKQNWRAHLRGAKDILLKYTTNSNKNKKLKSIRTSPILVFCKYWYISIEILAGLSSEYGGP